MSWEVRQGDSLTELRKLEAGTVQTVVTSPPYWGLRDYGNGGQLGLESTPDEYISKLVEVFREVGRVLRDDGTVWLNLGDSYAGSWGNQGRKPERGSQRPINGPMLQRFDGEPHALDCDMGEDCSCGASDRYPQRMNTGATPPGLKPKDLCGIPWRVAFALQADGWWLRSDVVWAKPNPMPESVRDRPTRSHEYIFLLTKSARYFFDQEAVREPAEKVGTPGHLRSGNGLRHPNHAGLAGKVVGRRRDYEQEGRQVGHHGQVVPEGGRNIRSVWNIATQPYKEAHFATFPEKLVEPCVLAGSSPKACGECGAPYERIMERKPQVAPARESWSADGSVPRNDIERAGGFYPDDPKTTGWQPTCTHSPRTCRFDNAQYPERCDECDGVCVAQSLVLDPFAGSGTVGVVALRHNRSFLGLELNPDYCEMARNRIRDDAPLLNTGLEAAA